MFFRLIWDSISVVGTLVYCLVWGNEGVLLDRVTWDSISRDTDILPGLGYWGVLLNRVTRD